MLDSFYDFYVLEAVPVSESDSGTATEPPATHEPVLTNDSSSALSCSIGCVVERLTCATMKNCSISFEEVSAVFMRHCDGGKGTTGVGEGTGVSLGRGDHSSKLGRKSPPTPRLSNALLS